MPTRTKVMRDPVPTGYLTYGRVTWTVTKFVCPGYVLRGVKIECGTVFESTTGSVERCQVCRKLHNREWHRLNRARQAKKKAAAL